ncbi:hypothetical protein HK098_002845 [Nowakowskiella sp. JEL0407]|nr:hypothetical protein HK098_002845 [Nowakowskiella sp. JEL0407]
MSQLISTILNLITALYNVVQIALVTALLILMCQALFFYLKHYFSLPKSAEKLNRARESGGVASFSDIPGPAGYPCLAVTPLVVPFAKIKRTDLFFSGLLDTYGDFCKIMLGDRYMVLTEDPAVIKKIANSDAFVRGRNFQSVMDDIAPYSLFAIPSGELWKKHRKELQPAFGPVHLRDTFKVSLQITDHLLTDVIAQIAFSMELGAVKSLESHMTGGFHQYLETVTTAIQTRFSLRTLKFLWALNGVSKTQLAPSLLYIKSLLHNAIPFKKLKISQKPEKTDDKWSKDVLDRLLEPQGSIWFNEEEIMSEMFGFFLAGHETTANTLTWAILELTSHPDVAEKLRNEVDGILQGKEITFEQIGLFKYVDAFIKETLRLHPVVTMVVRQTAQDVSLTTSDGFTIEIPEGVNIAASLVKVHKSKKYWGDDAEEFSPERWLIKDAEGVQEFIPISGSYVPFWDGPHHCIGQKVALIEAKVMIIRIIEKFYSKLSAKQGPIQPVQTLTLGLKNGLLVDVERRKIAKFAPFEFNAGSVLLTVGILTVGRSLAMYCYHYLTLPKDSRLLDKARKDGKIGEFSSIPGPPGYPFLANLPLIMPYVRIKRSDLFFSDLVDNYGNFCKVTTGNKIMVLTADAAINKKIATSDSFVRGSNFSLVAADIAPFSLFVIPSGDVWKKHRKGLQPAFGPIHLRETFTVSLEVADALLSVWEDNVMKGNNTRDVMHDFTMLTADVISKIAFSLDLGAIKSLTTNEPDGFSTHLDVITNAIQTRFPIRNSKFLWQFFGVSSSHISPSMEYLNKILKGAIEAKKQKLRQKSETFQQEQWSKDLLDRLLEPQGSFSFTEEEILGEAFGFFLAGHETTANTLTWSMLELSQHPEVFEKLRNEVEEILKGGTPKFEQLSSLKYVEAFIKETLRLHPVVKSLVRECVAETVLTGTDGFSVRIPKGVNVLASIAKVQTSKTYWGENAEEFYPDRWLIRNGDLIEDFTPIPGSFIPFWDGPHNCIGQKIAMIEAKVMIIRLVQKFNVELSKKQGPITPVQTLTFGLKNGLLVDVSKRT